MHGLKRTPLYDVYGQYGAKTIGFGGWDLPVQFAAGIQKEHEAVRQRAGLFDVSHMGELIVSGDNVLPYLQSLTTNDVYKLNAGQAQYTFMCYPDGGVVDDLLVYKLETDRYMLVVNAANAEKDADWLKKHAEGDVIVEDVSEQNALLALQGPAAIQIMEKAASEPVNDLLPFHFKRNVRVCDVDVNIVSRTGYTGEDGYELYVSSDDAVALWIGLMETGSGFGIVPAGLGARDTLRFEAKLPLYGQELSKDITPIEAGLGMFVKVDKGPFIGSDALAEQKEIGPRRKLVGIEMIDRGIPRSHYAVYDGDRQIGFVTTGTQSPTLKTNIGLALVDAAYTKLGTELTVDIRGKRLRAKVIKTPFYRGGATTV